MTVNPAVLFAWVLLIVSLSLIMSSLFAVLILLIVASVPAVFADLKRYGTYMKFSMLSALLIFVFNIVLLGMGSLMFSLIMVLRLLAITSAFAVFSSATEFDDIVLIMDSLKIPQKSVFSIALSMRFFPVLVGDAEQIRESMVARGMSFEEKGVKNKLKARLPILSSMVNLSLDRAINIAESLELHGFPSKKRTRWTKIDYKVRDFVMLALFAVDLLALIIYLLTYQSFYELLAAAMPATILGGYHGN